MTATNFTRLTTEQKTVWSRDLWKYARNQMFVNRFLGESSGSMIQHVTELTKSEKGARAVLTLVPDLEGDGTAGDRRLKGNEEGMKAYDKVIRVDQLRHAVISEGRMADQKSIVKFREKGLDNLGYWLAERCDQLAFLTLAGVAYSKLTNGATRTGSDLPNLEFAADVAAPSSARVFRWDAANGALAATGSNTVTAADTPSYEMLVQMKAKAKDEYIRGIRKDGSETFNVFFTPQAMAKLKLDENYIKAMRHAQKRGDDNPLFTGEVVELDGLRLYEFRHVPNTSGLASGSKYGAAGTVEGCQVLFCGAQALGMADIGSPEWVEEEDDYDNQHGISVAKIFGFLKPTFITQYGAGAQTSQDFGVMSVYVAQ
jgi:N4-gp56 family major capsid protein